MNKSYYLMLAPLLLLSCQKEKEKNGKDDLSSQSTIQLPGELKGSAPDPDKYNTFYGPAVQMGEGFARSWINITHENKPLAIGIEMTEGALIHTDDEPGGHAHVHAHDLPLHQKATALTPFDHIGANWSAGGHPPPGIYTVPHFDMHFYMMPLAEMLRKPSYPEAMAAFDHNPPAGYLPVGYAKSPAGEAKMGAHWMDVTSHEFQGQPFTHTLVYGSYDGKVTFIEPMVTLAVLQSGAAIQKQIRQPQLYDPSDTYYPTRYAIWKSGKRYYIALDGMVKR